jgi:hypothetical protein
MATEEKRIMSDQAGPEADQFAADFRDGAAMAQEWIEGRGDLPDLLHIVRDMPRGELGGLEAGFLASVDAAVRGARQDAAATPDPAKAKLLLTPPTAAASPEAVSPPMSLDEFHHRRRERERAARCEELWRANSAIPIGDYMPRDADGRGW